MPAAVHPAAVPGMLAPLRRPGMFRVIWLANLVSALGTTVQGVGAAWLMTSLAGTPDMVALVQTALLLPILLFALPAGALADTFDRRLVLIWAQLWTAAVSFTLAILGLLGVIDPLVLLAFTFFVGLGTALNGPAWQAAVREIVPRDELAAAVTLNAIAFNIARAVGPALGGALVAVSGAEAAFFVNAVSSLAMIVAMLLWRRPVAADDLPRERLGHAMITGLRYVQETPAIRVVLARGAVFGLIAAAVLALLPLVARDTLHGGAALYGILLGAFGLGALAGAFAIHPLRQRRGAELVVTVLTGMFGGALLVLAFWPAQLPVMLALAVAGAAWLGSFSTFNISVQMVTAPWVQARVLALYQTVVFGMMAFGSWLWGALAGLVGLETAQAIAAAALLASLGLHRLMPMSGAAAPDLGPMTSRRDDPEPAVTFGFHEGPVLVMIEYRLPPANVGAFEAAMEAVGHLRKRDGALMWNLFQDTTVEGHWYETFTLASWFDYLRQRRRGTAADEAVLQRARALLDPGFTPIVRRMIHRHRQGG